MAADTSFCCFIYKTYLFFSDKSKRRTKTVKKVLEPKWNQTFVYSHVHRRDFRERMLEITVWDQPRVQEEESEFLGEVTYAVQISQMLIEVSVICTNYSCFKICFGQDTWFNLRTALSDPHRIGDSTFRWWAPLV